MRVIWKDSKQFQEASRYKGYDIRREQNGWIVGIPGDNNIYAKYEYAYNAINDYLGHKRVGRGRFEGYTVKIIGTLTDNMEKEEGLSI